MTMLFGLILAALSVLLIVIPAMNEGMNDGVALGLTLLGSPGTMVAALLLLFSR